MKKDEIIWYNVERLSQQKGWSLVDLAKKTGTRPQTINSIKSGVRGVGANLLKRFLTALDVPEDELLKALPGSLSGDEKSLPLTVPHSRITARK